MPHRRLPEIPLPAKEESQGTEGQSDESGHGVSLCDTSVKNEEEIENLSMNHWTELCIEWLEQMRREDRS